MSECGYRRYLLAVLAVVMALSYVDRWGLSVAIQNIKIDLHLSDTEIGALTGIVYATFYSTLGIPIGRLADRSDRVGVMSVCMTLWTGAVMICGLATSFAGLAVARVVAAAGEAGSSPPAYSLISDYFSREERPAALGLYSLGLPMSMLVGYFLGGWLTQKIGWRLMFLLLGSPGIAMVPLLYLTVREPRRTHERSVAFEWRKFRALWRSLAKTAGGIEQGLWIDLLQLWNIKTFRYVLLALCALHLFGLGIQLWDPAFFSRSYQLSPAYIGEWFAAVIGGGYLVGTYFGGWLAARFACNDERMQLVGMAVAVSLSGVSQAFVYLSYSYHFGFGLIWFAMSSVSLGNGPIFAAIQTVVPARLRAVSISVIFFCANLVGMSLGPMAVGILSDALRGSFGSQSLRYALLMMCPGYIFAGLFYWKASRVVSKDVAVEVELSNRKHTVLSNVSASV